jgi:hypothetical protein
VDIKLVDLAFGAWRLDVDWQVDRHVEVKASYVHVGGRDVDFAMVSADYKF